ncbi:hypothetical protein Ais01nite_57790 [Asanoa ishikariensis]|uniref:Uncharacterized protein n=1 Tax=Asanoa ishikariensis TaxID=137265 RepID=A0A1H3TZ50_9ACTN|nr:hypothetical protein [Asanoa ishikariensis]GIF67744.1 hypothetical protein Ais01nite_57790 [Asanoa ishikariensis]SDZ55524.1 hypothetical protein SAMN05421684_6641 [Asanoa ishikariensis]
MTLEQRRAWIGLVVAVIGYSVYLVVVLARADGLPLTEVAYAAPLLWTIGAGIVTAIVAEILFAIVNPGASLVRDDRDREIGRLGDHVGQPFMVVGAVAAMLMAMADWAPFWIANVIYLGFVLSAVVGGIAKVVVYRAGVPEW